MTIFLENLMLQFGVFKKYKRRNKPMERNKYKISKKNMSDSSHTGDNPDGNGSGTGIQ